MSTLCIRIKITSCPCHWGHR